MPGMEARRRFRHIQETHVGRKPVVDCVQNDAGLGPAALIVWFPLNSEVGHLRTRMNAGIGTPRALKFHCPLEKFFSRFTQLALYSSSVALFLPATVLTTVVFDDQAPSLGFGDFQPTQCTVGSASSILMVQCLGGF